MEAFAADISALRTDLLVPTKQKIATIKLKKLIADVCDTDGDQFSYPPSLWWPSLFQGREQDKRDKFLRFWTDYFELLEVLDEKQSHIIQPVLKEKIKIFSSLSESQELEKDCDDDTVTFAEWYFFILTKMMHHDNRDIVKEGFLRTLGVGWNQGTMKNEKLQCVMLRLISEELLPLLRDHVGWVLPVAKEFFDSTKLFGQCLRNAYVNCHQSSSSSVLNQEMKMLSDALDFLVQGGTCQSPAAATFLVHSVGYAVDATTLRETSSPLDIDLQLLDNCCFLLAKTMTQGLTTVDKFLKIQIEQILLNVLVHRLIPCLDFLQDKAPVECAIHRNILTFFGVIKLEHLTHLEFDKKCSSWFKRLIKCVMNVDYTGQLSPPELVKIEPVSEKLSGYQEKGYFRSIWLSIPPEQNATRLSVCTSLCLQLQARFGTSEEEHPRKSVLTLLLAALSECLELIDDVDRKLAVQYVVETVKGILGESSRLSPSRNADQAHRLLETKLTILESILKSGRYDNLSWPSSIGSVLEQIFDSEVPDEVLVIPETESPLVESVIWKFFKVNLCTLEANQNDFQTVKACFLNPSTGHSPHGRDLSEFYLDKFDGFCGFLKTVNLKVGTPNFGTDVKCRTDAWKSVLFYVVENVDKSGLGGVSSASKCLRAILDAVLRSDDETFEYLYNDESTNSALIGYVNLAWNLTFEIRKTETFWEAFQEFVALICHRFFLKKKLLQDFAKKIFHEGENVLGLSLILLRSLMSSVVLILNHSGLPDPEKNLLVQEIADISVEACSNGTPLPKNVRVIFGLWEHLRENLDTHTGSTQLEWMRSEINKCTAFPKTASSRLLAIQILQRIFQSNSITDDTKTALLNNLLIEYESDVKKRYFGNSVLHRKKQRLAQTILVLQPILNKEQSHCTLLRLLNCLTEESPQPSVRYLTEWTIIRILAKYSRYWDTFFDISVKALKKRIGYGAIFSSICLHVSTCLLNSDAENVGLFYEKALANLTQLTLGHHATVRAYSQICFQRVFETLRNSNRLSDVVSKYDVIHSSIKAADAFCTGNSAKILQALQNDFYVHLFSPLAHYPPEVIFIYLPRLAGMASDELPTEYCLTENKFTIVCDIEEGRESDTTAVKELYGKHEKIAWHLKTAPVGDRELDELAPVEPDLPSSQTPKGPCMNFQKKINPWKALSVSESLLDSMSENLVSKKRSAAADGLVVIGSLVDRIPNLGGLCRSCEVFGVSKYVIPSMKILEDQQFQNLAVSSHNWVDIIEVPPKELGAFLATYKTKGYSILGIEQVQESVRLNEFKFPRKSVLLLGNEKYGIPPELIHLVDKCLEIPQVGVIRSLNVHVTGALTIWQYAVQHNLNT